MSLLDLMSDDRLPPRCNSPTTTCAPPSVPTTTPPPQPPPPPECERSIFSIDRLTPTIDSDRYTIDAAYVEICGPSLDCQIYPLQADGTLNPLHTAELWTADEADISADMTQFAICNVAPTTTPPPLPTTTPPPAPPSSLECATTPPPDACFPIPGGTLDVVMPISVSGCLSPERQRTVVMPAKSDAVIGWPFYSQGGKQIPITIPCGYRVDLTIDNTLPTIDSDWPTIDRINTDDCVGDEDHAVTFLDLHGLCLGAHKGRVRVIGDTLAIELPDVIKSRPSLYQMEVVWRQADGQLLMDNALVSIEPSTRAWMASGGQAYVGPLTITEIRRAIRDFPGSNELTGEYEYSEAELLDAIARPVSYYNETPPFIARYSTANFPYRENWLRAVVAILYETSAAANLRNDVNVVGEGVGASDKDRWKALYAYSQTYWQEYQRFVHREKGRLNILQGFRVM